MKKQLFILPFACTVFSACSGNIPVVLEVSDKDVYRIAEALDHLETIAEISLDVWIAEPSEDFPKSHAVEDSLASLSEDHGVITIYAFETLTREDGELTNAMSSGVRSTITRPRCTRYIGLGMEDLKKDEDLSLAINVSFANALGVSRKEVFPGTALWFDAQEADLEYLSSSQLEAFEKASDIYSRRCN